jgi:hypothetical protein
VVLFSGWFSQKYKHGGESQRFMVALMKGDKFDPNDDQQSVADTDFVGNAYLCNGRNSKETIVFTDG